MTTLHVQQQNETDRCIITVDDNSTCEKGLMGDDVLNISITTTTQAAILNTITPGDFIEFQGNKYYLNRPAQIEKLNDIEFKYSFTFEGEIYTLLNKTFRQPITGDSDFYLTDTAEGILDVLLTNINSINSFEMSGWTKGEVYETDSLNIHFEGDSCRNVLNKIANNFDVEFYLVGRQINIVNKYETATLHTFSVGKNAGLYELKRLNVDDDNTVTRAYLYGGSTNIPTDYRDGASTLVYESAEGDRYIEDYSEFNRLVEKNVVFDEIYPRFTGIVTAVTEEDSLQKVISCAIDFDINDHLMSGYAAKVIFKTGDLTGKEFEIEKSTYDETTETGTITLIEYTDDGDVEYPNETFYPRVDDEFTLIDMDMPDAYVTAAEAELLAYGQEWMSYYAQLRVKYELTFDSRYLRSNGISLNIGDVVNITDSDLDLDKDIRVTKLTINIDNPYDITAEISNIVAESWEDEIENKIQEVTDQVTVSDSSVASDISATKAWVAKNFAYLFSQNTFTDEQIFSGGINASSALITSMLNVAGDAFFDNIEIYNDALVGGDVDIDGYLRVNDFTVYHAGNDGPYSGMNADMLDNYHAASFPRKDEGATISGAWTYGSSQTFNADVFINDNLFVDIITGKIKLGDLSQFDETTIGFEIDLDLGIAGFKSFEEDLYFLKVSPEYSRTWAHGLSIGQGLEDDDSTYELNVAGPSNYHDLLKSDGTVVANFLGSGWQIDPDDEGYSHMVVDFLTVRRFARFYELEIDEITHVGGTIMLSAAHGTVISVSGSNLYFDTDGGNNPIQFQVDDYVMAQTYTGRATGYFIGFVTAVNQTLEYITVSTVMGSPYAGMKLVQCGNPNDTTRQAMIYMSTVESTNPYMSFLAGITDGTFDGKEVVQIGDLSNITHDYYGQLSGVGIMVDRGYFDNVYVRGTIEVTGGNAATQTYVDSAASGALSSAQSYTDSLASTLGDLAYDDVVELAMLGTTIISGGYISTDLINASWIQSDVINTTYIEGLALDFSQGTIGGMTMDSEKIYREILGYTVAMGQYPQGNIGFYVGADTSNFVSMFKKDQADNWGIEGYVGGIQVFSLGYENKISSFEFDNEKFYTDRVELGSSSTSGYLNFCQTYSGGSMESGISFYLGDSIDEGTEVASIYAMNGNDVTRLNILSGNNLIRLYDTYTQFYQDIITSGNITANGATIRRGSSVSNWSTSSSSPTVLTLDYDCYYNTATSTARYIQMPSIYTTPEGAELEIGGMDTSSAVNIVCSTSAPLRINSDTKITSGTEGIINNANEWSRWRMMNGAWNKVNHFDS